MHDQWQYVAIVYALVFSSIAWWFWMITSKLRRQRRQIDAAGERK